MFGKKNNALAEQKKKAKKRERKNKLAMYDHLFANFFAGKAIIEPQEELTIDNLSIGFNTISSKTYISKFFIITEWPMWLDEKIMDLIRQQCLFNDVKINFFIYGDKHVIDWDSEDMKNKRRAWDNFTKQKEDISDFDYTKKRSVELRKIRITESYKYLNQAEIEQHRTLFKMSMIVQISGSRLNGGEGIYNLQRSIKAFNSFCSSKGIKTREIRINMVDWLQCICPFSLKFIKEVNQRLSKQVLTDDIIATLNTYKQGKIGYTGMCVGMDVNSKVPVIKDLYANKDDAENWLVSAATGCGKSYFVKDKIFWALGLGIPVMVVDFEGDEYSNMYHFVAHYDERDAVMVSMGKGNNSYCDPMIIPALTGNAEVDATLKANAMAATVKMLSVIVKGNAKETFTEWENGVVSQAIKDVYDMYQVTEDKETWVNSKSIRLEMVYDTICDYVQKRTFLDEATENAKHRAAMEIREHMKIYFDEGASKYGTFKNPISVENLYNARLIIFSYGESGKTASEIDTTMLQLKQLSVANLMNQISNHCKYIRGTLNMKVIEEHQRWSEIEGSNEILSNIITGGRKRGDITFIITNDLNSMLMEDKDSKRIRQNLTSYAIGCIDDAGVRKRFCELMELPEIAQPLKEIAEANKKRKNSALGKTTDKDLVKRSSGTKFSKAFVVVLDKSDRAIVKVMLPKSLADTEIFKTSKIVAKKTDDVR